MIDRKGAKRVASTVINIAFKDLDSKNKKHRVSARMFFEDPIFLVFFCDLAEIDSSSVYNRYLKEK